MTVRVSDSATEEIVKIFHSINFEEITNHPNILIAANFWEPERYRAARVCYKFMRHIDDLIDDHKAEHKTIVPHEKEAFIASVGKWLNMFVENGLYDSMQAELIETIKRFQIPLWPLEDFARSMLYDINNDGFATLQSFIDYSRGASVAPASIFVHLCGLRQKTGDYLLPEFDVRSTATPCAMFSYLVHIMRDFQKDYHNNLNYFAGDMMTKHKLTVSELRKMAFGGQLSAEFRAMMNEYYELADKYRLDTLKVLKKVCPMLELRYRRSLEIIYDLYLMVFERIDPCKGSFTTNELVPTPAETRKRVWQVIKNSETSDNRAIG
ncbi:MAG TPA: squalene/phytoene synthase family protein [Bacteroidales bacterium]|nr:squalene/phytoene synthase family protein [Bacteroidales bacterium]